jgi:hypothetical protein
MDCSARGPNCVEYHRLFLTPPPAPDGSSGSAGAVEQRHDFRRPHHRDTYACGSDQNRFTRIDFELWQRYPG